MKNLIEFYNNYDEGSRLFKARAKNIEFTTTLHYLKKHCFADDSIADIGCGKGVYTLELASMCKNIYALDIVEKHINELSCKLEMENIKNVNCFVGSIEELKKLPSDSFNCVLCLGPYYHLQDTRQRIDFIKECKRITREKGKIFIGYINKSAAILYFIKNGKIPSKELYCSTINYNNSNIQDFDKFLEISYLSDPDSIEREVIEAGYIKIHNIAVDGMSYFIADSLEKMDESQWKDYVSWHLDNCEKKDQIGMSMHGLIVLEKT